MTSVLDDQDSRRYASLQILCVLRPCIFYIVWLQKYERRGRYVKPEEMSKWAKVDPSMMSDEDVGGKFKVHRQEWRSEEFNVFMKKLDDRASVGNSKPRPRLLRFHGTPQKMQPPPLPNAPEWMISNADNDEVLAPNSPN